MNLKAVIMAGGRGTRFWPLSRRNRPKQFLNVTGRRTLLQETIARLEPLVHSDGIFIACGSEHRRNVLDQLPGLSPRQLILEPLARNTAACIGLAAAQIQERSGESVMAALPADHEIGKLEEFHRALQVAQALAEEDWLVTFGITPTYGATGYGYLGRGSEIESRDGLSAFQVSEFVEKPGLEEAARLVEAGSHDWNSGMFVWKTSTILAQIQRHLPQLSDFLEGMEGNWENQEELRKGFESLPAISIDYAVMERAERVAVIPCDLGWNDVGNWQALGTLLPKDSSGNASHDRILSRDSSDCVVHASQKMVVLLGVHDLIVVDTPDALLVCDGQRAEEVKQVVAELKRQGHDELL